MFNPLGMSDNFLFCGKINDKNAFYSNNEDFFTPKGIISLQSNFYLAAVIYSFRRMNIDVSLGKNS